MSLAWVLGIPGLEIAKQAASCICRDQNALAWGIAVLKCGEVYVETQMERNAKCAARVTVDLAGHAFHCSWKKTFLSPE